MGGRSQKVGAAWEQLVIQECKTELKRDRARVARRKPEVNILEVEEDGKVSGYRSRRASVDFDGHTRGQVIFFDTKHSENPDRFDFSQVEDEQLTLLATEARAGAITFLYVLQARQGERDVRWVLPVDQDAVIADVRHRRSLTLMSQETRESVRWDSLPGLYRLEMWETWLDAVLRLRAVGVFPDLRGAA